MQRVGSMITMFFAAGPIRSWAEASRAEPPAFQAETLLRTAALLPAGAERQAMAEELDACSKALVATRSLRAAVPASLALDLQVMAPWHGLVMRCWALAARLRQAGVTLPPLEPRP